VGRLGIPVFQATFKLHLQQNFHARPSSVLLCSPARPHLFPGARLFRQGSAG